MKPLEKKQRDTLADVLIKFSYIAGAALVFGQFVPGYQINWVAVVMGVVFIIGSVGYAVGLKRKLILPV